MPRTARKVDELAEEGEHMTDALGTVLTVAEEQGTVTWSDVSDDISSGEWGRLIEKGLLVDAGGDGFVLDDPDGVRDALDDADPADSGDDDLSWTIYDKMAALTVVGMFAGYAFSSVRSQIGGAIDLLLGPLREFLPFYLVIMALAILTGVFSTFLQDNLMNTDVMGDYQEKSKELKERRKKAKERGDDEELERIQEEQMEMMSENLGVFKAQFRPMVWIMTLTIPVFLWMYYVVRDHTVEAALDPVIIMPLVGEISGWQVGVFGPFQAWLLWYFICSLGFTQILRKAMNVQTSPTS
ncbi:HTR-like protein [Halobacteriales archaeon QH_7_66_37]|nr:MAG: HTR-like protein [Halobacteriales archaeon QH_7_66_37]